METKSHNKHLNLSAVTEKRQKQKLDNSSCLFVCQLQDYKTIAFIDIQDILKTYKI